MIWARMLAYITGTVDQGLLLRNEYLAAENRILRAQIKGRLLLSDAEKATLAEIGHRLGRKALEELSAIAKPDTRSCWVKAHCGARCATTKPTIMGKEITKAKTTYCYSLCRLKQSAENGKRCVVGSGWAAC
jgi:hypothetical protein